MIDYLEAVMLKPRHKALPACFDQNDSTIKQLLANVFYIMALHMRANPTAQNCEVYCLVQLISHSPGPIINKLKLF